VGVASAGPYASLPPRSRQITTPAPHHSVFTGRMPFLPPNQRSQSTERKEPHQSIPVAVRRVANCYTPFTLLYFTLLYYSSAVNSVGHQKKNYVFDLSVHVYVRACSPSGLPSTSNSACSGQTAFDVPPAACSRRWYRAREFRRVRGCGCQHSVTPQFATVPRALRLFADTQAHFLGRFCLFFTRPVIIYSYCIMPGSAIPSNA